MCNGMVSGRRRRANRVTNVIVLCFVTFFNGLASGGGEFPLYHDHRMFPSEGNISLIVVPPSILIKDTYFLPFRSSTYYLSSHTLINDKDSNSFDE